MGNTGDAEGEEDEAGDESQSQGQDGDRPQASRRKKQQSSQSSPFSLVNFKVKSIIYWYLFLKINTYLLQKNHGWDP